MLCAIPFVLSVLTSDIVKICWVFDGSQIEQTASIKQDVTGN